ncbi:MAG: hypothetical protein Kow0069_19190 [Promethearchaeota archaeon]
MTSDATPLSGSAKLKAALIVASFALLAAWGAYYLLAYQQYDEHDSFVYDPSPTLGDVVTVDASVQGAAVKVIFTNDEEAPLVHVDFHRSYNTLSNLKKDYHVTWNNETAWLKCNVTSAGTEWALGYDSSQLTISLREGALYDVIIRTTTGKAEVRLESAGARLRNAFLSSSSGTLKVVVYHGGTVQGDLKFETDRGDIFLRVEDSFVLGDTTVTTNGSLVSVTLSNATLGGTFNVNATTGRIALTLEDLVVLGAKDWEMNAETGSISVDFSQMVVPGGNLTLTLDSSSTTVLFSGNPDVVGVEFNGIPSDADVSLTGSFQEEATSVKSTNFPSVDWVLSFEFVGENVVVRASLA